MWKIRLAGRGGALTRGFLILDSLFLIEEGARGGRVARCPLKRSGLSGLGVTLLCSVSVNLAELRRAQTRSRAVSGKDIC